MVSKTGDGLHIRPNPTNIAGKQKIVALPDLTKEFAFG